MYYVYLGIVFWWVLNFVDESNSEIYENWYLLNIDGIRVVRM